jgi:sigma-B regulation protein RsbQ
MTVRNRNNIHLHGDGPTTMVFAHGFGCDQTMWHYLMPMFEKNYRMLTFDLVGSGGSDISAYSKEKYGSLHGYADDLIEIVEQNCSSPCIFVGHSVSAIIGVLATIKRPDLFAAQAMVGPSPCYVNDATYHGGFTRADIDDLLQTMDNNFLGWSSSMAPVIMGSPGQPELGESLTASFCRNDPDIARHFAAVTFLSDHRGDLAKSSIPALILQCTDDLIAPCGVGEYMHAQMPNSTLTLIDNVGHCPHMSAPGQSAAAIVAFLDGLAA